MTKHQKGVRALLSPPVALLACAVTLPIGYASAQQPGDDASAVSSSGQDRAVYGPDYFVRYNPATAEDIVGAIPGASAILEGSSENRQQRGFGSGGTRVLLNGRRFPGKANDLSDNLRRIPANAVARVELISSLSRGMSVQSEGMLVNIVLKEGVSVAGTGSWEAYLRFNDQGRIEADGRASYNGVIAGMNYTLGIERNVWSPPALGNARWSDRFRDEVYYFPNGAVRELRPQYWERDHNKWIYTGSLTHDFDRGDRLQINAFYQTLEILQTDKTAFTRFDTSGVVVLEAVDAHVRDTDRRTTLELGGEYTGTWGGGDIRALAIVRRDASPTLDYRNQLANGAVAERSRSESQVDTGEDILRVSYAMPLWKGHSLEVGVEGARNTLDQHLSVFFDRNNDGLVEMVDIPTAEANVEELRGEAFATYRWPISAALSLETSLNYETARITNNYPFSPERTLSFWKPRIDARYRLGPRSQMRFLAERSVSQLDFTLFVPRFDFVDNEIDAGNPEIEPEKTWTYELGYEFRLPADEGLLEGRLFYKDISDPIDKIPLLDSNSQLYSADGNLSGATVQGAEVKASLRLAAIQLPDALLSLRYVWQQSDTRDPFTGETRRLKDDFGDNYEVSFRHDVTDIGLSYGVTYRNVGHYIHSSDLLVREYFRVGPVTTAFLEKQIGGDMSLRIEAQNVGGAHEAKTRLLYELNAMDGALRQFEHWDEDRDLRIAVGIRGAF